MPLVKNFLTEAMTSVKGRLDHISDPVMPEGCEVDSRYREQAESNLRRGEKHFMWGKASDILTMVMSSVLMGGVTGTIVHMAATAGAVGMAGLVVTGLGLAAASLAAAYVSFKSQGHNFMDINENNAKLNARFNAKELAPAISQMIGQEVRAALQDTTKSQSEDQAMIAGARHTNSVVPAAVATDMVSPQSQALQYAPEPKILFKTYPSEPKAKPTHQLSSHVEIAYDGKISHTQPLLEATTLR